MHAHGAAQNKKMAIEVHNAAAPGADSAVSGLPKWGISNALRPASTTTDRTCRCEGRGGKLSAGVDAGVVQAGWRWQERWRRW